LAGAQDGRLDELLDTGTYKLRLSAAHGATGSVGVAVTPFRDAAPPAALPAPGVLFAADLTDGRQRSFWLGVAADGRVRIAATGRALADLRLWRDGRDLVDMAAAAEITEAVPGRPMTTLTLQGSVEPGTYLVTAYGGPAATWSDGNTAQPFYLRQGVSDALEAGWAGGTIGPTGTDVLSVPRRAAALRLDLPRVGGAADCRAARDGRPALPDARDRGAERGHRVGAWALLGVGQYVRRGRRRGAADIAAGAAGASGGGSDRREHIAACRAGAGVAGQFQSARADAAVIAGG
jgi:hypothetical protein